MSNRLDKVREAELPAQRKQTAILAIQNLGYKITYQDQDKINFWYNGAAVHFYFLTGWATGKGIKDCRGLESLLNQIRN